ncbi:hypothetical protein [Phormidium pseudopriestleyi]|uniref:hypothetical protein n=1 Tax=Phormidium pseudopriestleyi TaxID=1759527 RepID=UPI001A8C8C77|nr:hypothetical protein [Phormidium pseudopriestleyi]
MLLIQPLFSGFGIDFWGIRPIAPPRVIRNSKLRTALYTERSPNAPHRQSY